MTKKKQAVSNDDRAIAILKSGKFTIAYHDTDCAVLYKGHHEYDELGDDAGRPAVKEVEFDDFSNSYTPAIVELLVRALGGRVCSI